MRSFYESAARTALALALAGAALAGCELEEDEREVTAQKLHGGSVTAVAFSEDGSLLASAGEDDTLRVLDVSDLEVGGSPPVAQTALPEEIAASPMTGHGFGFTSVAFTPEGSRVIGGNYSYELGGFARAYSLATGDSTPIWSGFCAPIVALAVDSSGPVIAAGIGRPFGPGRVVVRAGVEPQLTPFESAVHAATAVALSQDATLLAWAATDGRIRVYDIEAEQVLWELAEAGHEPRGLAFSPDGTALASVGNDGGSGFDGIAGRLRLWELEHGTLDRTLSLSDQELSAVAFSHDGTLLAAGGEDRRIRIVDVGSNVLLHSLRGHGMAVNAIAFSPDEMLLASGGDDAFVRLWYIGDLVDTDTDADTDTGEEARR